MLIASLWHNIAPYQGNNLPLPGTKRYVGSFFIKAPLFFLLFTLHQIGWNPDKHWGCERWRVTHHSSPLFTTLHLDILFIGLRWVNRAFLFHGLRTDFKRKIDLFGFWRKSHRFGFPFGRRFSIHRFSQIFRKRLRVYTIVDISFIRTFAPSF